VHGDLSEYNILVVPSHFIDLQARSNLDVADEDLHIALIDFGQAVDANHPSAHSLLERDLDRVLTFFGKQGVETMTSEEALSLVFA
jgi:serine/threonine-protein kinase RIO1